MLRFANAASMLVAAGVCACAFLAGGVQAQLSATLGLSANNLQKNGISVGR